MSRNISEKFTLMNNLNDEMRKLSEVNKAMEKRKVSLIISVIYIKMWLVAGVYENIDRMWPSKAESFNRMCDKM